MVYNLIYNMHISGFYDNSWLIFVKKTLDDCGFSYIWNDQNINISVSVFKNMLKLRLRDQYIQKCKIYTWIVSVLITEFIKIFLVLKITSSTTRQSEGSFD